LAADKNCCRVTAEALGSRLLILISGVGKRHQTRRDEGERLAVYGAEVCGELLDEAIWFMGLREIGERVGLHFSAVGNSVQRVANRATGSMAQSVRELERRFKNQES
jgi:hypothetical protein